LSSDFGIASFLQLSSLVAYPFFKTESVKTCSYFNIFMQAEFFPKELRQEDFLSL
jgi:hypothetical protein